MRHDGRRGRSRYREDVKLRDPGTSVPRALGYLRPYRMPVAVILACLIASALLISIPPLLIRELIDVAVPEGDRGLLNLLVAGMTLGAAEGAGRSRISSVSTSGLTPTSRTSARSSRANPRANPAYVPQDEAETKIHVVPVGGSSWN